MTTWNLDYVRAGLLNPNQGPVCLVPFTRTTRPTSAHKTQLADRRGEQEASIWREIDEFVSARLDALAELRSSAPPQEAPRQFMTLEPLPQPLTPEQQAQRDEARKVRDQQQTAAMQSQFSGAQPCTQRGYGIPGTPTTA